LVWHPEERNLGSCMSSKKSGRSADVLRLPNHTILYGIILFALGGFVTLGSLTRLYEFREFFPLRLPEQVNEFILNYVPFILGTFITAVASLAGVIVGINWLLGGFRQISRLRVSLRWAGDYYRPENVSLGLKEGKLRAYSRSPSVLFSLLSKFWSNAGCVSEIPAEIVRMNMRFLWKAVLLGMTIHFVFQALNLLPAYVSGMGLGEGYVVPSPMPFYNLLITACLLKFLISLSLIPLKKPGSGREMDSMIVEGRGHPSVFFAILEEGSKVFSYQGFPNRIYRSRTVTCEDGETLLGTLIESFPEHVKTSARMAALISLLLGAVMILVGFLQIILMQYPSFSVSYEEFFRMYLLSLLVDIILNVAIILMGKSFLEQARSLMSVYRFRSSLVYAEAKGDFERKALPDLGGIVAPERLFNPLSQCAFNVRYFSAEAISEAITPEGIRDLVALETSGRLAKDVARLKFLPFQVSFVEKYPSSWRPDGEAGEWMGEPLEDTSEPEDAHTGEETPAEVMHSPVACR
jgi:hypothetical protein